MLVLPPRNPFKSHAERKRVFSEIAGRIDDCYSLVEIDLIRKEFTDDIERLRLSTKLFGACKGFDFHAELQKLFETRESELIDHLENLYDFHHDQ